MCSWMELPQLLCLQLLRMGKEGRRKGLRKKEEEKGKSFAAAAAAGLGPWLWSHACARAAGVLLCFLCLLA